jgi:hypothetical protein
MHTSSARHVGSRTYADLSDESAGVGSQATYSSYAEARLNPHVYDREEERTYHDSTLRKNNPHHVPQLSGYAQVKGDSTPSDIFPSSAKDATAIKQMIWTPHPPCEGAQTRDSWYSVPEINSQIYKRMIAIGAEEQPYSRFNRPQTFYHLVGQQLASKSDMYTRPLNGKTYCQPVKN